MVIGDRLREIRERKKLSQADVQNRTGLLRGYISRVENGHTVPAIGTLERIARAFEVPMYQLFYESEKPPEPPVVAKDETHKAEWGSRGKDARSLRKLQGCLGKMDAGDRQLLLGFAYKVSQRNKKAW